MTVINLKSQPALDPNRKGLAAAIALEAGARRDLRVADDAASLAAQRCWQAQARLDELRKIEEPKGSLAAAFTSSVAADAPCETAVLQRSGVDARAQIAAAENEFSIWNQTREECGLAAREKKAAVVDAREHVERAARRVVSNSETVTRLMEGVEELQAEVINRRVALRFILFNCLNGELSDADKDRIESLFRQDRLPAGFHSAYNTGWETHSVHRTWQAAFEELQSNSDAALPS